MLSALHVRRRPLPSNIARLIEVCDTSFKWDRSVKVPLYARAGVAEVWLIDLNGQRLIRYLDPEPAPPEGWRKGGRPPTWRHEDILVRGDSLAPAACPQTRLTTDEILAEVPPTRWPSRGPSSCGSSVRVRDGPACLFPRHGSGGPRRPGRIGLSAGRHARWRAKREHGFAAVPPMADTGSVRFANGLPHPPQD